MNNVQRSSSLRYIVAALSVGLALLVTQQVELLAHRTPFALFFAAVMVSTWYGGRNPGLLAIGLSALVSDYFIIPPLYSFRPDQINFLEEGAFIIVALFITYLTSARQRAEQLIGKSEERYVFSSRATRFQCGSMILRRFHSSRLTRLRFATTAILAKNS